MCPQLKSEICQLGGALKFYCTLCCGNKLFLKYEVLLQHNSVLIFIVRISKHFNVVDVKKVSKLHNNMNPENSTRIADTNFESANAKCGNIEENKPR